MFPCRLHVCPVLCVEAGSRYKSICGGNPWKLRSEEKDASQEKLGKCPHGVKGLCSGRGAFGCFGYREGRGELDVMGRNEKVQMLNHHIRMCLICVFMCTCVHL